MLENESARRNRFEAINSALFKISNAVNTASNLDELFQAIHLALSSIIDTTNFYIALYDEAKDTLTFPYFIDSADDINPPVIEAASKTESITAEVIRTGLPVMMTKAERLCILSKSSLIKQGYTPAEIWLGVPLKTRNQIVGVMTVQSYHDPKCFDQTDMDVMVSVADQVATAIERKQADEALRNSETTLNLLLENIPIPVFSKDNEGRYLGFNKAFEVFFGKSKQQLIGKSIFDISPLEIAKVYHAKDAELLEKPGVQVYDSQVRDANGVLRNVIFHKASFTDAQGSATGLIGVVLDITERKQAEEELKQHRDHLAQMVRERTIELQTTNDLLSQEIVERKLTEKELLGSRQRFQDMVEQIYDWIWEVDTGGQYTYVSIQVKDMLGYEPEEVLGKTPFDLMPAEEAQRIAPLFQSLMSEQRPIIALENINLHKDGRQVYLETSGCPFYDTYGNLKGYRGSDRNISERKQVEAEKAELEAQNRQLQKTESLGRMAGAIAHHFNNQFHVVIGNLEMAMNGLPLGANPIENLASAMQATQKAAEVSSLMLTYLGQTHGKREHIDLSEACRQSLPLLQAAVPKGTIIKADFPSIGCQFIHSKTGQIQHVLINLITNSCESSDESRRSIGLTIKTVSPSDIPATMRFPIDWQPADSAYVCLEVTDAGCGIAENDIEKIFDPFFSTKFTGRGLGLSVVLGIVRAHHGVVTVESKLGQGSIFRLFFPLSVEKVAHQPDKAVRTPKIEESGIVLLVEDEEWVRLMTATMISHLGFKVLEATDGVEAVEVFRQHQDEICCVLTDLTMPRMDGWETLASLRKLSPDIPVILSSGYDETQVMAGEHPVRPNAFLGKPYRLQELKDAIRHTLVDNNKAPLGYEPL